MDSGGTLSTTIKGRQCDSPPDMCAPRQLSATEPLFSAPWGEARPGRLNLEMPSPPSTRPSDAQERRSSAFVREDSGRASGSALLVDHRRLLDRGDRLDRLSPNSIWLVSRVISVDTEIAEELRAKVVEIVNTRPVHRTLESSAVVVTSVDTRSEAEPRAVPEPSGPDGKIP